MTFTHPIIESSDAGAGKSSVVGALLRLTEIEAGEILIDSIDVRTVRLARLRSAVGFVPQSTFLFEACLRPDALICLICSLCHLCPCLFSLYR